VIERQDCYELGVPYQKERMMKIKNEVCPLNELVFPDWLEKKFDDYWKVRDPECERIISKANEIIQRNLNRNPSKEERKERRHKDFERMCEHCDSDSDIIRSGSGSDDFEEDGDYEILSGNKRAKNEDVLIRDERLSDKM
jgi:hypothetical protein